MKKVIVTMLLSFVYSLNSQQIEIPAITKPEAVIVNENYTLQYNEKFEQADWVAYELTKDEVLSTTKRKDSFKSDPEITTGSASLSDYKGSGYDRGHLAPAADMKMSAESMSDSFYMSNMSPQVPGFNRGIWKKLEELVRDWAIRDDSLFIVTGPVLNKESYQTIGVNEVAVQEFYYKVILDYTGDEIKCIGFILPNEKSANTLEYYAVSVDEVEEVTLHDFFPNLPVMEEASTH